MFQAQFIRTEEKITAKTGLVAFAELINIMKIPEFANKFFPASKSNNYYEAATYLQTLILTLYGGGESLSDARTIRDDHALREMINLYEVPSESALGDWLRWAGKDGIAALHKLNQHVVHYVLQKCATISGTQVLDPTMIKAEKDTAKMTYEGYKGYRPAIAFLKEFNLIIDYEFREGNDTGRRLEQVTGAFDALPKDFCVASVLIDSEFYQADVINYLNAKKKPWIIAADQDTAVVAAIRSIPKDDWRPFFNKDGIKTDREIAETVHTMNQTDNAFRLIILRWKDEKAPTGYSYHCKAAGATEQSANEIALNYNERAEEENVIKELKNGFGARKMPCGTFEANAVFFGITVLVYNLFIAQKLLTMPKEFVACTIKTIRWMFVDVPGKLIQSAGKLRVFIAASREVFTCLIIMRKKNYALFVGYS